MKKTVVPALILTAICLVVVSLLVLTNEGTKARIAQAEAAAREEAVRAVLVGASGSPEKIEEGVYAGYAEDGTLIGYAFETFAKGYGGEVATVVGISVDGKILGVSVTAPDETPGLGANVAKDDFTSQFKDKDSVSYATDFEAVTSATYSSDAVKAGIAEAFEKFESIQKEKGGES